MWKITEEEIYHFVCDQGFIKGGLELGQLVCPCLTTTKVVDSTLLAISLSSPELYHLDIFHTNHWTLKMALSDPPTTNVLAKLQPHSAGQECMVSMIF